MEVECGVLGNRVPPPVASLPGAIDTLGHEWYDFESKYDEHGMQLVIPPELPQETIELVQQRSVDAFVASECEGLARVDFFVRASDGEVIVNELNTMPGFTATSVYAKLFEASGIPYVRARRPADRARAGAARAPLVARVLACALTSFTCDEAARRPSFVIQRT